MSPPPPTRTAQVASSGSKAEQKSGNGLRVVIGLGFLVAAVLLGLNAFSGSSDSGSGGSTGGTVTTDVDIPSQDYSIQQSCEEIRADYMAADPGSEEERWALEAADEVCFGQ